MKTGILIVIALLLCLAAVPYGTDLACVYVRPLDMRDGIYKGIGIPRKDFTDKYGGLSERTLIIGNLQVIPQVLNELDGLKTMAKKQDDRIKSLEAQLSALTKPDEPTDPNEVN